MKTLTSFVLAACLALPAAAAAQTASPDPLGTWNATFNTQNGVIPATLKLAKTGEKITGSIASPEGETPVEAEYKEKTLKVWFNYAGGGGGPIPIEMTGTIDGDTAKGTMTAGGSPAGDWSATREKAAKAPAAPAASPAAASSLTGDWNVSLQLDTITATPSLTLKQDGDKLTGEYTSQQYGKFPLTGSVKGTEMTFTVSMSIEGNAISADYNGVIQPDGSIKGGVDLGGAMSGSFTATRKK